MPWVPTAAGHASYASPVKSQPCRVTSSPETSRAGEVHDEGIKQDCSKVNLRSTLVALDHVCQMYGMYGMFFVCLAGEFWS